MLGQKINNISRAQLLLGAVWIITFSVVIYLWSEVGQSSPIIGFVDGVEHDLSTTHDGKIQEISVALGQQVTAGQIVAVLDSRELEARVAVEQAELERIKAGGTKEQLQALETNRRFAQESETASADLAKAQNDLSNKKAELATLTVKHKELSELLAKGMVVKRDVINIELRQAALQSDISALSTTIKMLRQHASSAQTRRAALPSQLTESAIAQQRALITVVEKRLEQLFLEREGMTLRAPVTGRISSIHMHEGDVARVGDPVISMISDASDKVVACVYENRAPEMKIGAEAILHSRLGETKILKGHVIAIGPVVKELPIRCRPQPNQPAWGSEIVVLLDSHPQLIAGEAFNIAIKDHQGSGQGMAIAVAQTTKRSSPAQMQVPKKLSNISHLEPSGLIWVPRLSRYVIVSDDTGKSKDDEHAPWLYTMDSRGRVDEQPIRVTGIESFNDLESIAAGPDGALYVLSSQTYSKKGKRKEDRQAFCRLVAEGKGYHVEACVDFAQLLDDAGQATLAKLGLSDTKYLNIEGLTAQAGALYLGLKAPLDENKNAIIWRMKNPEAFLRSGKIAEAGLSLWANVSLQAEVEGQVVPGGIAELLWLPSGQLLITSTASGMKPKLQTGSLWLIEKPLSPVGNMLSARAIQSFTNLKPEGLALSPNPGKLMIVFDADQQTPSWLEMPWPHN